MAAVGPLMGFRVGKLTLPLGQKVPVEDEVSRNPHNSNVGTPANLGNAASVADTIS